MYKDKDKQREAVKVATQRYRAKTADSALSGSKDGLENARGLPVVGKLSDTQPVIPSCDTPDVIPKRLEHEQYYHQPHCNAPSHVKQFAKGVSCSCRKRGKDIKCFADLPPDVQETIHRLSTIDGKIDQASKAKRTAAAIKYQHLFPDRYNPQHFDTVVVPAVTGKPGDADYNGVCTKEWRQARGR